MAFSRKRGRPPMVRAQADLGTPELIYKRLHGVTAEPLDACLQRGLLTGEQHWSGVHFRWLYTLRYGTASAKAVDTTHTGGRLTLSADDPAWRAAREEEYRAAAEALHESGLLKPVVDFCVDHATPLLLRRTLCFLHKVNAPVHMEAETQWLRLKEGLDLLASLWQRRAIS